MPGTGLRRRRSDEALLIIMAYTGAVSEGEEGKIDKIEVLSSTIIILSQHHQQQQVSSSSTINTWSFRHEISS